MDFVTLGQCFTTSFHVALQLLHAIDWSFNHNFSIINTCPEQNSNLRSKAWLLLEFAIQCLRPLGHHRRLVISFFNYFYFPLQVCDNGNSILSVMEMVSYLLFCGKLITFHLCIWWHAKPNYIQAFLINYLFNTYWNFLLLFSMQHFYKVTYETPWVNLYAMSAIL